MQPKCFAPDLVTADDRRIGRQLEADLRAGDLLEQPIGRTGGNLPQAWPLAESDREAEFPRAFTELECQQQRRRDRVRHCGRLLSAGHGPHRDAPLKVVFQGSVTT